MNTHVVSGVRMQWTLVMRANATSNDINYTTTNNTCAVQR